MFLGIMEHKKKIQLVHFKSFPNLVPSLNGYYLRLVGSINLRTVYGLKLLGKTYMEDKDTLLCCKYQ